MPSREVATTALAALRRVIGAQGEGLVRRSAQGARYLRESDETLREAFRKTMAHPVRRMSTGLRQMGPVEKALVLGLTGAHALSDLSAGSRGRGERIGGTAGSLAALLSLRRVPLAPALAGMVASRKVGSEVGKRVGRHG